jgi:hypothetical protein
MTLDFEVYTVVETDYVFLGYGMVQSGRWLPFQGNLLPPSFGRKMEKVGSSEVQDYMVP